MVQQANLPVYSVHCFFNAERQAGKLWMLILKLLVWPDSDQTQVYSVRARRSYHSAIWVVKSYVHVFNALFLKQISFLFLGSFVITI